MSLKYQKYSFDQQNVEYDQSKVNLWPRFFASTVSCLSIKKWWLLCLWAKELDPDQIKARFWPACVSCRNRLFHQQISKISKIIQGSLSSTFCSTCFWPPKRPRQKQLLNISSTSCFSKTFRSSGSWIPHIPPSGCWWHPKTQWLHHELVKIMSEITVS